MHARDCPLAGLFIHVRASRQLLLDDVDLLGVLQPLGPLSGLEADDATDDLGEALEQHERAGNGDHGLEMIDGRSVGGITYMRGHRERAVAAEEASRAKSIFLATISHELRTPLNAIIGFSEILKNQMFGPLGAARYRGYVDDIYGSGVHLLSLVNDLLDLAKAEAGKHELNEDDLDIGEIADTCSAGSTRVLSSEASDRSSAKNYARRC